MTGSMRSAWLAIALLATAVPALSAPLDKETCDKLKEEQARLSNAGTRATMAGGPEWAKANLKPDQLAEIAKLIDIDAQVAFRCIEPKAQAAEARAAQPRPRARLRAKGAVAAAPATAPAGEAAPAPASAPPATSDEASPVPKAPPQRRSAAKPKVNDAYAAPPVPGATASPKSPSQ